MVVKVLKMAPVGPSTSTSASSNAARTRLTLESHFMPRPTPLSDEAMYSTNATAMMVSCSGMPACSPNTRSTPAAICTVPKPSAVATPTAVATTAEMLTTFPIQPR
ncbi:hypothetical protein D3C81_1445540 [compost metagenome]